MDQTAANTTNIAKQTAYAKCKILGGYEEERIDTGEGECTTVFTDRDSHIMVILMDDAAVQTTLVLRFGEEEWNILIVK